MYYQSRSNDEPETPGFRPKKQSKSLLGKRLHKQQESEEPEARGCLTCETSAESSYVKTQLHKVTRGDISAELRTENEQANF